jgi:hypothetical protein
MATRTSVRASAFISSLEHPTFKAAVRRIAEGVWRTWEAARGSAETEAQIEEYWQLGCKVLSLPSTDVSTYLDGLKARAGRAHARLKIHGRAEGLRSGASHEGAPWQSTPQTWRIPPYGLTSASD